MFNFIALGPSISIWFDFLYYYTYFDINRWFSVNIFVIFFARLLYLLTFKFSKKSNKNIGDQPRKSINNISANSNFNQSLYNDTNSTNISQASSELQTSSKHQEELNIPYQEIDESRDTTFSTNKSSFQNSSKSIQNKRSVSIFRELLIIFIGTVIGYVAIGFLSYSFLVCGRLLRDRRAFRPKSSFFAKLLGILFNPIGYIGILYYFYLSISSEFPLLFEFGAILLSGLIYRIMYAEQKKIIKQNLEENKRHLTFSVYWLNRRWARMAPYSKAISLILLIGFPALSYGYAYGVYTPKSKAYMVSMTDGVRLHTVVVYPKMYDGSPRGVILIRTPYGADFMAQIISFLYSLKTPYICVVQDLRGTGKSEGGSFPIFSSDKDDGIATTKWILSQSWSNGKIVTYGGSAVGINQFAYHGEPDCPVSAADIMVATPEPYDHLFYVGGCLRQGLLESWFPVVNANDQWAVLASHPTKDSYWANSSLGMNERYKNINIRAVHRGGWYDIFTQGTIMAYKYYNNGTEYAKKHQILIMGPWSHDDSYKFSINYPNSSTLLDKFNSTPIFDEALQGIAYDWENNPHVYYYVMGDPDYPNSTITYNHWRTANDWPIPSTPERWYFYPNGTLLPVIPSKNDVDIDANKSYLYDPRNPVRNGGGSTLGLSLQGPEDQRQVEYTEDGKNRSDILKFTSPVLNEPVEIIGQIFANLKISSNCTDTDFNVKLIDIYPDGREMWVAEGILKARYHNGFKQADFLTPNQIYQLTIDMWSTAYRFVPGHQIRISITSSNYNKFAINPNTGGAVVNLHPEDLSDGDFYIANNSVYCGSMENYSSFIEFPRTV